MATPSMNTSDGFKPTFVKLKLSQVFQSQAQAESSFFPFQNFQAQAFFLKLQANIIHFIQFFPFEFFH